MLSELLSGDFELIDVIIYIISCLTVIFLTLPVHEFAHGFAAVKLGDNTPRWQGRLTLNPFAHIDYIGALAMLVVGYGWAKPVGVNALNFRNPKRDMALTALAGPVANLIMAFIFLILANICNVILLGTQLTVVYYIGIFCWYVADINVSLAIFNFIPIPPLDGSRLLAAFLPDRLYYKLMQYERMFFWALIILLSTDVLDKPLYYATSAVEGVIGFLANLPFKLIWG